MSADPRLAPAPAGVRPAAVAGMFYPGAASALAADVDLRLHLAGAGRAPAGPVPKLLLVPHAGYVYSGPVAASAYATLAPARGRVRRVVLLGPTHRVALHGLALPGCAAFETPLGRVAIDRAAMQSLVGLPQVGVSDAAHAQEHSLEVQLPFLQRVLGEFALVPIAVGRATLEEVAQVIERLWGGSETLIVISSDLSHYLPYDEAQARDGATIARVLALDPMLETSQACGAAPLAGALLCARRHGHAATLLDLRNSGDTAGDRSRVVGYAAVRFDPSPTRELDTELLERARDSIAGGLGLEVAERRSCDDPRLAEPGATFVSLHREGRLRGCIGSLQPSRPLGEDVQVNARAAAFHDPRFSQLTPAEAEGLHIEISVLGALEPLPPMSRPQAIQALRPGVDGLILASRGRHATFLPQVWTQLPRSGDFLAALERKAGLTPQSWADEVRLFRYGVRSIDGPFQRPAAAESRSPAQPDRLERSGR